MNVRSICCLLLGFCGSVFAVPALAVGASLPTFSAMAVNQPPMYSALGQPQISVSSTMQVGSRTLPITATSNVLSQLSRLRLAAAMSVRGNLPAGALLAGSAAAAYYFETNKYYFNEEQQALYAEAIEGPVSGAIWQGSGGYSDVEELTLSSAADAIFSRFCANAEGSSSPCDSTGFWRISDRSGNAACLGSPTPGCYVRVELRRTADSSFNGQNIYLREFNQCSEGTYDPEVGGCVVMQPATRVTEPEAQRTLSKMPAALFNQYLQDMIDKAQIPLYFPDFEVQPEFDPQTFIPEPETTTSVRPDGKTETRTKTQTITVRPYIGPDGKVHFDLSGEEREVVYVDGVPESDETRALVPTTPTAPSPNSYTCSHFQFVCDFFDWFRDLPDEPDEDFDSLWSDDDFERVEYDLELGSGSCPPPKFVQVDFLNKSLEFKFDIVCDMALAVRPLFIAFCYIMSAFAYVRYL